MKILLCGGESPLGKSLVYRLEQLPFPLIVLDADTLATISASWLESLLRDKQIDGVVNVQASNAEILARAAAATGSFLLQLSDCQVFSGKQAAAYRETDEQDAVAPHGAMLCANESVVIEACPRHLVLRTGELFSSLGPNVLTNLLDAWLNGNSAPVSVRYQFCPTSVRDAARVIVALLQQLSCGIEPWGVYHYCGTDAVSYRDFARLVKQIIESQPESDLVMEMHEIAEGLPQLSWTLDCSKIRNTFGIKQHAWRAGLTSGVKRALLVKKSADNVLENSINIMPEGEGDGGCD
jgi:dTDP-4-dehydrorhamnose reductase